jgi:multicomponent Na+:H+ antiporter subunit E
LKRVATILRRSAAAVAFVLYFIWELVLANLRVAYDVVTPQHYMRPAILAIPLEAKTDAEITLLANLISLTPGTLSLDVSSNRQFLYVHTMYLEEPEDFRKFEARLLKVMR